MALLRKYLLITALWPCAVGCYSEFEPDIDNHPVLCINSLITAGEPVSVAVSHTWHYSDVVPGTHSTMDVTNADVELWANGRKEASLVYSASDRCYHSVYIPSSGDTISIHAHSPDYGSAQASVVVPAPVPIDRVEWTAFASDFWRSPSVVDTSYFSCMFDIDLSMQAFIADPIGTDNYYRIAWHTAEPVIDNSNAQWGPVHSYYFVRFDMSGLDYEWEPLFSEHISVLESVFGSDAYGFTAFTDRQFSGRTYPLHLRFTGGQYFVSMPVDGSDDFYNVRVVLTLESISPSYYNWLIYEWQADNGLLGSLGDVGFADGFAAYSNVSTGAGVVAARAHSDYSVSLSEFIKQQVENLKSEL